MTQLALFSPAQVPHIERMIDWSEKRDGILAKLRRRSGSDFMEKATAFVVVHLRRHGPTSGEDITDAAKSAGIIPPGNLDDRAFGPVFNVLSRRGLIVKAGYCQRRKGRNTAGGLIWRLK